MFPSEAPSADVFSCWEGYLSPWWFPSVMVADELGIFARLADAPLSVEETASELALNDRALGALLPMLASLGYLASRLGRYHLTDTAATYFVPDSEFYWGGVFASSRRDNSFVDALRRALTTMDSPKRSRERKQSVRAPTAGPLVRSRPKQRATSRPTCTASPRRPLSRWRLAENSRLRSDCLTLAVVPASSRSRLLTAIRTCEQRSWTSDQSAR